MDDEASIIYGLDFQTRALCAQTAETEIKRFLIGTQSLKYANQVHLIEYDDETNSIEKCIYDHKDGEVWYISASPQSKSLFFTCYDKLNTLNSISKKCTIWQLPDEVEMTIAADDSTHHTLKRIADLPVETTITAMWEPSGKNNIVSLSENFIFNFDCNTSTPLLISKANLEAKGQPKFSNCKWNLHHNFSQIATCNDTAIRGWDLKSMKQSFVIDNAHGQLVRDIDFNPNKQYYIASCGDDCKTKFWDIRKPNECLKTLSSHSHWVWSVRYNTFHDQLLLTCSSDNRVVLNSIPSLSSEPYRSVIDEETQETQMSNIPEPDREVKIYEDHEDSVYAVEWSSVEPWVFASLSYDGRLVINKVPKDEKYKILL